MFVKVPVADLEIGMYIVNVGLAWLDHPYIFSKEGAIESNKDVASIIADGFIEAFVDPARSKCDLSLFKSLDESILEHEEQKDTSPLENLFADQPVALNDEHPAARKIYRDSINYARYFMDQVARTGCVDIDQGEEFVRQIVDSMMRNTDALLSLGKLRLHDEYTFTHCINVTIISVGFAKYCRMSEKAMTSIGLAALFHDVGKALIPKTILNKPGKLSNSEFMVMREHPIKSHSVLSKNKNIPKAVLRGVVEHHEKVNGNGYPYRLRSPQIHAYSKIISLADVFDALTSRRVYKNPMSANQALKIMYELRGSDFNASDVVQFIKYLGVYPVGTLVRLNNGSHAVVTEVNHENARCPIVVVAFDQQMRTIAKQRINLADQHTLAIIDSIDPKKSGVDPLAVIMN